MSAQDFVAKWSKVTLTEKSASQQHFLDLCYLVGHPTPAEADQTGETFTFEKGASKQSGGEGWADVWKKDYFAWEYKGKHKDLSQAYQQLLQYRESLMNPPLLVVSDMEQIIIHTNFTNTVKQVVTLKLNDLVKPENLAKLRAVFFEPENFRLPQTTEQVTQHAAAEFARLADLLRKQGADHQQAAHFLIRLLFCLFAEDIGLLPKALFTQLVKNTQKQPSVFREQLRQLFRAMASGGWFGVTEIAHFDGRLFDDDSVLELDSECLEILARVSALDWSNIEPSIFGTLFEGSLDHTKRSQLGEHYTSKEDILLVVEPVLMAPLRRRWAEVRQKALDLAHNRDESDVKRTREKYNKELTALLKKFAHEIAQVRVLDSACGSGNFLYVALKQLLDLEKEVVTAAYSLGLSRFFPSVSPAQLHGIEINAYAHELAQATIWIGYIQWLHDNGFGMQSKPILKPLDTVLLMDAILAYDEKGQAVEPEWPEADVIIGNPPFLGGNKVRQVLGDEYVDKLFALYKGRVPAFADLVCYWFEKARSQIQEGRAKRAGLLATNSIRDGASRRILERVIETGNIFMAWSDRPWVLEGASVRVSIVGFDNGAETHRVLDGITVANINPDLTASVNVMLAKMLNENRDLCFYGSQQKGSFEISPARAKEFLAEKSPFGRDNRNVVKRSMNAIQLLRRTEETWVIDFGVDMPLEEAVMYEGPFEYVKKVIYPERLKRREMRQKESWWLHARPSPRYRDVLAKQTRYIATPAVSKHIVFVWLDSGTLASHRLIVFARDDDYFFGVLHSRLHTVWALRMGSVLEDRPCYTPTTTFETFPFPWSPGKEPKNAPRIEFIAQAARELVEKRDAWLNPEGAIEKELKKRTLTNLYNQRPTWLDMAHRKLDEAVLDAYSWPHDLSDQEILSRLLALNLQRATG